jgi:hypothetical protein
VLRHPRLRRCTPLFGFAGSADGRSGGRNEYSCRGLVDWPKPVRREQSVMSAAQKNAEAAPKLKRSRTELVPFAVGIGFRRCELIDRTVMGEGRDTRNLRMIVARRDQPAGVGRLDLQQSFEASQRATTRMMI